MTVNNRRKEKRFKAKTGNSEESFVPSPNSAMADKAEREPSFLPSSREEVYIAKIEDIVRDWNIQEAIGAVKRNKGAPGIDGITTEQIEELMHKHWPTIKQQILEGTYVPKPVRRVEIPKPDGQGIRQLGIPNVMDRIIQQALHQKLVYVFEPHFSKHSYGFRPYRNAQQAVLQAQRYIQEGCEWVIDIDSIESTMI